MAGVDYVAEELVGVFLAAPPEVLGEEGKGLMNLGRGFKRPVEAEGSSDLPLEDAEGALLVPVREERLAE